jgi:hypothetical protein
MDPTITALLQGMQQRMAPQATQAPTTNQPTSLTSGPVAKKWKASELKQDPTPYMVAVDAFIASQGLGAGEALGGSTKEPGKNTGSEPMSALKVKADAIRGQAVDNLLKAGVRADLLGQWLNSHKNIQYEEGQKSQAFQRAMRIAEFQRDGPILVQAAKEGHIEGVSKDLVPDPEKETEEQQEAKRKTLRKLYDYVAKMPSGEYIGVAKGKGWRWVNNLTRMDRESSRTSRRWTRRLSKQRRSPPPGSRRASSLPSPRPLRLQGPRRLRRRPRARHRRPMRTSSADSSRNRGFPCPTDSSRTTRSSSSGRRSPHPASMGKISTPR